MTVWRRRWCTRESHGLGRSALVLGLALLAAPFLRGAELVYVFATDCPVCAQFDAAAGAIYPRTEEARIMPMRRVSLASWQAAEDPATACVEKAVIGTPTFLLIDGCAELDRITGYSNDELFWLGIARMRNRLSH